jgi:hypothetical protein
MLTFTEQVHEERVDATDLWPNINLHRVVRYDMHFPVRQKPNLSTLVSYLWYDASLRGRKVMAQLIHRVGNQPKYLSLFD